MTHQTKVNAAGRTITYGDRKPSRRAARLKLRRYMRPTLPSPPTVIDYSLKALPGLDMMLANDTLSDCLAVGAMHISDVFRANAGTLTPFATEAEAIEFYSAAEGYVPGDPATDVGGDAISVLTYWRDHGLFKDGSGRIAAFVAVDATNLREVQTALWLFENLFFAVALPDAWVNPPPSEDGFVFDVAGEPNLDNGHGYMGFGYNPQGVRVGTWAMEGLETYRAVAKYTTAAAFGELYTVLGPDAISKASGRAPNGLAWADLVADIAAIPIH